MGISAPFKCLGDMLYPNVCAVCQTWLVNGEEGICLHCFTELPRTHFGIHKHNPVEKLFWGRVALDYAGSFMFFHHKGMARQILHKMKYQGDQDLATSLGKLYAADLLAQHPTFSADMLIPVPLHPRKLRQRGYNQSQAFGQGISEVLGIELRTDLLTRNTYSATQTKKSRFGRWLNVDGIFSLKNAEALMGKHIILIDDVITTGATLEACVNTIKGVGSNKTGILSLAFAKN